MYDRGLCAFIMTNGSMAQKKSPSQDGDFISTGEEKKLFVPSLGVDITDLFPMRR